MANPVLAKIIGVKVAAANIGDYVIVRNLTRGGQLTQKLAGTDRSAVFNPAASLTWQDGDVIQAEIRGRMSGVSQQTIKSGGANIIVAASADTSTPGVTL